MSNFKFTWGHGIIVAMLCFICFILGLIFLFPIGKQNSDLVSKNYYEDELAYQEVIDAKNYTAKLTLKPNLIKNEVGFTINFPKETQASKLRFYLYNIVDSDSDIRQEMQLNSNNQFVIPANLLKKGAYILKVYWVQEAKNCQIDFETEWN